MTTELKPTGPLPTKPEGKDILCCDKRYYGVCPVHGVSEWCFQQLRYENAQLKNTRPPLDRHAWRPIGEAPKDGDAILIAYPTGESFGQSVAWWKKEMDWSENFNKKPNKKGEYPKLYRGAWVDGGLDGGECEIEYQPTHFMPLPAPPQDEGKDAK